jgi:thiol-disulfide isomerase/thioredoxin
MMRIVRSLIALVALTAVPLAAQDSGIAVGAKAPNAKLTTLDGKPADLAQFVGKRPTLMLFWAAWCSNCKQLEPQLTAAAKKYGAQVSFVGVAVAINQSAALAKAYAAKHQLPLTSFYDGNGAAAEAYDAPATSYIVVIDKTGKVVYTGVGADQNIEAAVKKGLGA